MAELVLGIGCAHTPQIHTRAKDWNIRADRDRVDGVPFWWKGRKLSYAELEAARAGENLASLLGHETRQTALDACFAAIDRLHDIYREADPDVVIVVGNDQNEIFSEIMPAFTVIAADEIATMPRTPEQIARLPAGIELADHGHLPASEVRLPGRRDLALHVTRHMMDEAGFDITLCHQKPTVRGEKSLLHGMPHAYGFLYQNLMRNHIRPHIPVDVNCWYYDNSPSAARCYDFGGALARAISSWEENLRVAVFTTGGLTHFVVDPEWDRAFLDAMATRDASFLRSIPQNELMAGTSECKSWIATAGAMDEAGLSMEVIDYQTLIRTEGGTGSSCAFVTWR